jgi:hypothetical protein
MKITANDIDNFMAQYNPQYCIDDTNESVVVLTIKDAKVPVPIKSGKFRAFIKSKLRDEGSDYPTNALLSSYQEEMDYKAREKNERINLPMRVAWKENAIIYDLNDNGKQVKITDKGWNIVQSGDLFRENSGLPVNIAEEGTLDGLFDFINISDEYDRILFLCVIFAMLIPDIPHCILGLSGLAGSGKTTVTKWSKMLIDPWAGEISKLPELSRTMEIFVSKHYVSGFDNISILKQRDSDFICCCTTGETVVQKINYTDSDLVERRLRRCFILNGITRCMRNKDLLSRSINLELEKIPDGKHRLELDDKAFKDKLPVFRAAIFTILSKAMDLYFNHRPKISSKRLADFYIWAYCIAEAITEGNGDKFVEAYDKNFEKIAYELISSVPVLNNLSLFLSSLKLTTPIEMSFEDFYNQFYRYCENKVYGFIRSNMPPTSWALSHFIHQYSAEIERMEYKIEYLKRNNQNQPIRISRIEVESEGTAIETQDAAEPQNPSFDESFKAFDDVDLAYDILDLDSSVTLKTWPGPSEI